MSHHASAISSEYTEYTDVPNLVDAHLVEDRRDTQRMRTVYRIARVRTQKDEGLARVRNISDGGLRLSIGIDVEVGELVEVTFSQTLGLTGRVVWVKDGECGLKFVDWVDSIAVLRTAAEETRAGKSRPPRLHAARTALVSSERGLRATRIQDISQRGMKITHDGSFTPGLPVKIVLGSGVERRGNIRWVDGKMAGVILTEQFSVEELGSVSAL
jgi:hypothetical protein